jgi:undecaprenol kinase
MNSSEEVKVWQKVLQSKRFAHAFRGLRIFGATTRHLFFHLASALTVILLGFYFKISGPEWVMLVFAIGLVLITEALNTAIEIDINLTSPEYHPYARDTKDVAAAAVLLSVFTAITIGLVIFIPRIFIYLML